MKTYQTNEIKNIAIDETDNPMNVIPHIVLFTNVAWPSDTAVNFKKSNVFV